MPPDRREFVNAGLMGAALAAGPAHDPDPPLAPPDRQPAGLALPDAPARKAGWAVVGLGHLALEEVMPAFAHCKRSRPVALVSGHPDKARRVAAAHAIDPRRIFGYADYGRIAEDRAIDIVYVILPNSMHAEHTISALKAGKHVLCEKPMAATSAECEKMIASAKEERRKLMVAYRLHYEPMTLEAIRTCRAKDLGAVRTIPSSNCQDVKAPNIRLSKGLAGGPVGDVGVYSINAARAITGEERHEVTAVEQWPKDDPRFREVPASVAFTLRFPGGALAHCGCSFNSAVSRRYRVHCSGGLVEMDPAFSYRGLRLLVERGDDRKEVRAREVNQFAAEMDHFSACVLDGKAPRTPAEMGLADMRVIEAIARSARTGRAVRVKA